MSHLLEFLQEDEFIDFSAPVIANKAIELFRGVNDDLAKVQAAYVFVRDEIPHSFDVCSDVITAKASDVLKHKTGICHAKSNLLAALLRSQNIPAGFCFQRVTLGDDDSNGYVVHCFNAIFLNNQWVQMDVRGSAFACRPQYDEYFWPGAFANPHYETMQVLEQAKCLQDVLDNLPDTITAAPDIKEIPPSL